MSSLKNTVTVLAIITSFFVVSGCGLALEKAMPKYSFVGENNMVKQDAPNKEIDNLFARYYMRPAKEFVPSVNHGTEFLIEVIFAIIPTPPIRELDKVQFTVKGLTKNDMMALAEIQKRNSNVKVMPSYPLEVPGTSIEIEAYAGNYSRKHIRLIFNNIKFALNLQLSSDTKEMYKEIFGESPK